MGSLRLEAPSDDGTLRPKRLIDSCLMELSVILTGCVQFQPSERWKMGKVSIELARLKLVVD